MARGRNVTGRFIERIYGRDGEHETLYLLRIKLLKTRWGGLYFHVFHRGDLDPDPHDHPWDFWTFPLTTYRELVWDLELGRLKNVPVDRFRWHYRPATYVHRVVGKPGIAKIFTFVWHGPSHRGSWGFWVDKKRAFTELGFPTGERRFHFRGNRVFIPWREYVYSQGENDVEGTGES